MTAMKIQLELEEYEALSFFAREGAADADKKRQVEAFLQSIEKKNSVTRYFLVVQWQEAAYALPPTARFPNPWPPEMRFTLERTDRPIARADVEKVLSTKAKKPVTVMITTDPGGELGWQAIDTYFKG
jgi:hypothetical protein